MYGTLQCTNINLDDVMKKTSKHVQLRLTNYPLTISIISIYISPTGNVLHFLHTAGSILIFYTKTKLILLFAVTLI